MIDLTPWQACACKKFDDIPKQCQWEYTIGEQGKSIRLIPKSGEHALAIVLDGCVMKDNDPKCDALFLYMSRTRKYSFLVEIKGSGDIRKAFHQLSYTSKRTEYNEIIKRFRQSDGKPVVSKFAVISNGMLSKPELERLEKHYQIRVKKILHCEATTPIPDLKSLL